MDDKCAHQLSRCFAMVRATWTPSSPPLAKMNDGVSLLTNFSELKFDHRFGCPLDREVCTPTFTTQQAIFTPFNPNLGEIVLQSLTFEGFLRIKI